jgi:hypothetical protein
MKLTQKDKEFLETLKRLVATRDLVVDLKPGRPSYLVLRGTYGDKVHAAFRMTRQGVRWRFHRLFNDVYVAAFETILFVEQTYGSQLRQHAVRISQERYALRQRMREAGFQSADAAEFRRQTPGADVD